MSSDIEKWCMSNYVNSPYLKYSKNIFTQNGEDGIIERLFNDLSIATGNVVEFGAWDGIYISNIYRLWKYMGYNGLLIECDNDKVNELRSISSIIPNIEVVEAEVSSNRFDTYSLDNILSRSRFNFNDDNFSLLSIDVDSLDYQIWESLEFYKPKIVLIECNYHQKDAYYIGTDGSSFKSLIQLGESKGYKLVCYNLNAIFVRNDLFNLLNIEPGTFENMYVDIEDICHILQKIDENGNFTKDYRYLSEQYKDLINRERTWF